jgi:hypothetical protein
MLDLLRSFKEFMQCHISVFIIELCVYKVMEEIENSDEDRSDDPETMILRASRESTRILDEARLRNTVLRLVGGLAIHIHCTDHSFCDRRYGDIDFVGLKSQYKSIVEVMKEVGYAENPNMTISSGGARLLFEKPGTTDHIDVFLDRIDIEHDVNLRNRLDIEKDTISVSDLLLVKLTITRLNEKDIRDIITMVKDIQMEHNDSEGAINTTYIAELCAKSWGLHHDVMVSLKRTLDFLPNYTLSEDISSEVSSRLEALENEILNAPKSLRWRLRAMFGERIPWRREIETTGVVRAPAENR